MSVAIVRWRGPVSSLSGPMPDGTGNSLPIPCKGTICGLLGAAFGFSEGSFELTELQRRIDIAVLVHDSGIPFTDFQTADLTVPRMARHQLTPDGTVLERGGATNKERAIILRPYVAGFSATILVGGLNASDVDEALRSPVFETYLGRRGCVPSIPLAGGILEGGVDDAVMSVGQTGDLAWRLTEPADGMRFGVDLVSLPERGGAVSWWIRQTIEAA